MKLAIATWVGICVGMIVYGKKREQETDDIIKKMNEDRKTMNDLLKKLDEKSLEFARKTFSIIGRGETRMRG